MGKSTPILVQLRRVAKARGASVAEVLQYYAMERFLFRLGRSTQSEAFVLKGAMLFRVWDATSSRSTRDIDFLSFGPNDLASVRSCMLEIMSLGAIDDGIQFDHEGMQLSLIKEHDEYPGVRVKFTAMIESARIPMQLDIGFGDAVRPEILWEDFPVFFAVPAPRIRVYSRESIIAEKTHAMAKLGLMNSRLKDYYDIWLLSRQWPFESPALVTAIEATFNVRSTDIPLELGGLSQEYVLSHHAMWDNYLKKNGLAAESLDAVTTRLATFLLLCLNEASSSRSGGFRWNPQLACWE